MVPQQQVTYVVVIEDNLKAMLCMLLATIPPRTFHVLLEDTVLNATAVYTDVLSKSRLKHTMEASLDYTERVPGQPGLLHR